MAAAVAYDQHENADRIQGLAEMAGEVLVGGHGNRVRPVRKRGQSRRSLWRVDWARSE